MFASKYFSSEIHVSRRNELFEFIHVRAYEKRSQLTLRIRRWWPIQVLAAPDFMNETENDWHRQVKKLKKKSAAKIF